MHRHHFLRVCCVHEAVIAAYESSARQPSTAVLEKLDNALVALPSALLQQRKDDVLALSAKYRATSVRVFGSVARGEDRFDSDIDLLIAFEPGVSTWDRAELWDDLSRLLAPFEVDLVSAGALRPRDQGIVADAAARCVTRGGPQIPDGNQPVSEPLRNQAALLDLADFIQMAAEIARRGKPQYDADIALRLAGEAILSRVGEVVNRLPEDYKASHPKVPWRGIRRTRNLAAHEYDLIDHEQNWVVLETGLPMVGRLLGL